VLCADFFSVVFEQGLGPDRWFWLGTQAQKEHLMPLLAAPFLAKLREMLAQVAEAKSRGVSSLLAALRTLASLKNRVPNGYLRALRAGYTALLGGPRGHKNGSGYKMTPGTALIP
jgi:hypothetical protein